MHIQTLRGIGGVPGEVEATNCAFVRFRHILNSTADPLYREHLQLHNSILVKEIKSKEDSPDVLYPWVIAEASAIWVCSNALALALNDAIPLLVVVDMVVLVIKGRWFWWWGGIDCHWSQPIARIHDMGWCVGGLDMHNLCQLGPIRGIIAAAAGFVAEGWLY